MPIRAHIRSLTLLLSLGGWATAGFGQATDLIISEYLEGSGFNKYIEVYNGTGAAVNLADYQLRIYANGVGAPNSSDVLSGILADGTTIVYAHPSATVYPGPVTVLSINTMNFNGDDALELYKISTASPVDIFGKIGCDPGTQWSLAGNATLNRTLRRVNTVCSGVTVNPGGLCNAGSFPTLGAEWTSGAATDDFSDLGNHSILCLPTVTFQQPTGSALEASGAVTVDLSISPAPATAQTVTITVTNGAGVTYGAGGDYTSTPAVGGGTITVNIPAFATAVSFTLNVNDDALAELDETITLEMTGSSAGLTVGSADTHVHTILNDDFNSTVEFGTVNILAVENSGVQVFQFTVFPAPATAQSVTVQITNGPGAVYATDYVTVPGGPATFVVNIAAGATTASFSAILLDDLAIEPNETVTFSIIGISAGLTLGTSTVATLTIADNDSPPTVLAPGDLLVVGVNANDGACGGSTGLDEVSFFCFQDIVPGTILDLTDCGYQRNLAGLWGDNEGAVRMTRTGPTIPAGQVITFRIPNSFGAGNMVALAPDAGWTCTPFPTFTAAVNLNVNGDQLFFMQSYSGIGATWSNPAGTHNADYTGTVLYGFSTNGQWLDFGNSNQQSGLPPSMECFSMAPTTASDWSKYNGLLTATNQRGWIIRVDDATNWASFGDCNAYAAGGYDWTLAPILPITTVGFTPGLWTGQRSTDWFDCINWDDARVPVAATDVVVDQSALRNCVVGGGGAAVCNDLNVRSTGATRTLSVNGASSLTAGGDVACERLGGTGLVGMVIAASSTFQGGSLRVASVNGASLEGLFRCSDPTSQLQVLGNVDVQPGGYLDLGGAGAELRIGGDYTNSAGDVHFNDATATLTFNGTVDQTVDHSATEFVGRLRVDKPSGDLYLSSALGDLIVRNNLDLLQGRVFPGTGPYLQLQDNATATNASDLSFVHGMLVKVGNDAFTFPVGKGNLLRPIGISTVSPVSGALVAEYYPADPNVVVGGAMGPGLDHISSCEYWLLEPHTGTPTANVTLTWRDPYSCEVTNLPDLRIAHYDGPTDTWYDRGNGGTTGNLLNGTIELPASHAFAAQQPYWALASVNNENPLPIELLAFSGRREGEQVRLEWVTASEQDNDYFTLERSADGADFTPIATVDGAGTSFETLYYTEPDRAPLAGWNYYRLWQTDFDGTTTVSPVVAVWMPAGADTPLTLQWDAERLVALHGQVPGGHWTLLDATGRILREGVLQQEHRLELGIGDLPPGTYLLRLSDGRSAESARFVR